MSVAVGPDRWISREIRVQHGRVFAILEDDHRNRVSFRSSLRHLGERQFHGAWFSTESDTIIIGFSDEPEILFLVEQQPVTSKGRPVKGASVWFHMHHVDLGASDSILMEERNGGLAEIMEDLNIYKSRGERLAGGDDVDFGWKSDG